MKILYLDLGMGAAGDMLTAALYELINNKEDFINEINAAGIPGTEIKAGRAVRCGICGTHMQVITDGQKECSTDAGHEYFRDEHEHSHEHSAGSAGRHHPHRTMAEIEAIIDALKISDKAKSDVKAVYKIIAQAESRAHGVEVSQIHFHEVGMMDAVADITAACCLMEKLSPDKIIASPVCTGFGHVHSGHGVIPVPAPAAAFILEDLPSYEGDTEAELCTPTGAALVKYFADEFGRMPVMFSKKTGYGMGTKNLEKCNVLRAVFGEGTPLNGKIYTSKDVYTSEEAEIRGEKDKIIEFSLTVDDMTGEEIGFACERLFEAGALDVYTQPVFMKKNRPGIVMDVLVKESERDKIISAIFRYTSTLGIREALCERYILKRRTEIVETEFGPVRKKISEGCGARTEKFEYEDLSEAAVKSGLGIREIKEKISGS